MSPSLLCHPRTEYVNQGAFDPPLLCLHCTLCVLLTYMWMSIQSNKCVICFYALPQHIRQSKNALKGRAIVLKSYKLLKSWSPFAVCTVGLRDDRVWWTERMNIDLNDGSIRAWKETKWIDIDRFIDGLCSGCTVLPCSALSISNLPHLLLLWSLSCPLSLVPSGRSTFIVFLSWSLGNSSLFFNMSVVIFYFFLLFLSDFTCISPSLTVYHFYICWSFGCVGMAITSAKSWFGLCCLYMSLCVCISLFYFLLLRVFMSRNRHL